MQLKTIRKSTLTKELHMLTKEVHFSHTLNSAFLMFLNAKLYSLIILYCLVQGGLQYRLTEIMAHNTLQYVT